MRFNKRKPLVVALAIALMGSCLAMGCSPKEGAASSAGSSGASAHQGDWKALYPLEYWSFAMGGDAADDVEVVGGRPSFSHATMPQYMAERIESADGTVRGVCLACKSSTFNDLYEEGGDAVFAKEGTAEFAQAVEADGYWDCGMCHADMTDPAASVGAQSTLFQQVGSTLLAELEPETAACGQCHNNANTWMSSIVSSADEAESADPYRYGSDADGMMKAVLEDMGDAAKTVIDERTGVYVVAEGGHPDVEMFQGSVMQQAGLSCTDCHMPTMQTAEGEAYTSHNASKSPMDSAASLDACLDCHKNQGIETVGDMYDYVRAAQQEVADLDAQVVGKLAELNEAVGSAMDAGIGEEAIESARERYATAAYYRAYVLGNNGSTPVKDGSRGEAPGEKVAHNPQMSREYLQRASAIVDDALSSLGA